MAGGEDNEVLMLMVDATGSTLAAECQTDVSQDTDTLVAPTDGTPVFTNGSFFQVMDFKFGLNIDDQDPTADAANPTGRQGAGVAGVNKAAGPQVKFGKWKSGSPEDIKKMVPFPVRMDEFSVTRIYDRASPVLFEKCAISESFQSAALIKRKVTGNQTLQSFLRMDFDDVLITHIDWSDGDVIKEQFRFVFRKMLVQYRTQAHDGTLNPSKSYLWEYKAQLVKKPGGQ